MSSPGPQRGTPRTSPKRHRALGCIEVLGELAGLFARRRKQLAESVGLSVQQWSVLEVIHTEHFMPSLFAQEQERSAAAVSKILRQLSNKKLIVATVSDLDARQRNYEVTAKGQATLAELRQAREQAIEQVWLELTQEELDQFEALGSKVAEKLRRIAQTDTQRESA